MIVNLELIQVTELSTGNFNVNVKAIRNGTGEVIGKKDFTVTSKIELKDSIRPVYAKLIAEENRKEQLETVANQALQELMLEFYPST